VNIFLHLSTVLFAWKNSRYSGREAGGSRNQSGRAVEKREMLDFAWYDPEFDDSLAHSVVIVQTGIPGSLTMLEGVQCRAHCERRSLSSILRVPKRVRRTLLKEKFLYSYSSGITHCVGDKMKKY
jgi:hypothetical protein